MDVNQRVAAWTHGKLLTRLQRSACQILPNGFSIALSIRELLRAGYLFSADILLRPLIERVAVISYLVDAGDQALDLWEQGWPHKSRPHLATLLKSIKEYDAFPDGQDLHFATQAMINHFNSIVHADPLGLDTNIGVTPTGTVGYLGGANLNDPERCDHICLQASIYTSLLMKRAAEIFPRVNEESVNSKGE